MQPSLSQKIIMRRVKTIWFLRRLVTPFALKSYIALGLIAQILLQVSVVSVFKNVPDFSNLALSWNYLMRAFADTEFGVQAVVLVGLLYIGWIGRDALATAFLSSPFARSVRHRELA